MQHQHDPVDEALKTLGLRNWPSDYDNHKLKEKIMQDFQTKRSMSLMSRRNALAATLAIALLGTAGFAAAGGLDMVRGWFITVTVNGEDVDLSGADIVVSDDGQEIMITTNGLVEDVDEPVSISVTAEPGNSGSIIVQDADGNVIKTLNATVHNSLTGDDK